MSLPLKKPKMLSRYGHSAKMRDFDCLQDNLAADVSWNAVADIWKEGTLFVGGGSGATGTIVRLHQWRLFGSERGMTARSSFGILESTQPGLTGIIGATDACLISGNAYASEGVEKEVLRNEYADELILSVAANCTNITL